MKLSLTRSVVTDMASLRYSSLRPTTMSITHYRAFGTPVELTYRKSDKDTVTETGDDPHESGDSIDGDPLCQYFT